MDLYLNPLFFSRLFSPFSICPNISFFEIFNFCLYLGSNFVKLLVILSFWLLQMRSSWLLISKLSIDDITFLNIDCMTLHYLYFLWFFNDLYKTFKRLSLTVYNSIHSINLYLMLQVVIRLKEWSTIKGKKGEIKAFFFFLSAKKG